MNQEILKKYIEGDASPEERRMITIWAKEDEKNMSELRALRKLFDTTLWQRNSSEHSIKNKKNRVPLFYRISSVAAVLFLLISIGIYIQFTRQNGPEIIMQTIHVPAGQRVELELTDGTSVWLNAGTTFTFPNIFTDNKREVMLNGEGYFNVQKNEKHPFIVKTEAYDIKVLGTEFNVMAYGRSYLFDVSLLKGRVEVSDQMTHEKISLEPNTRAYLHNGKLSKGIIENYDYLLWKDGLICFDDEPVDKMITKLELYYDIRIFVANESFKTKKYTGKFRTKEGIEHILKVFQLKDKFIYIKDEENNTITIK